jgi:hypothetical protein
MNYLKLFLGMLLLFLLSQNLSAQSVDTLGVRDTVIVALQNRPLVQQDSVRLTVPIRLKVTISSAAGTDTIVKIYFLASPIAKFKFIKNPLTSSGAYPVRRLGGATLSFDSARVSVTGDSLTIKYLTRPASGTVTDSIEIPNVFVKAIDATAANDGSTKDSLEYAIGSSTTNDGTKLFILMPGPTYRPEWDPASMTDVTVDAGHDFGSGWELKLQDFFGNTTTDMTTVPTLSAVLATNPSSPGSGVIINIQFTRPAPGLIRFTRMAYTRKEVIKVKATVLGRSDISPASVTVNADTIAQILVMPPSPSPISVGGSVVFSISGTDRFGNPVDGTPTNTTPERIYVKELQGGGGTFSVPTGGNAVAVSADTLWRYANMASNVMQLRYTAGTTYTGTVRLRFQGMDASGTKTTPPVEVSFTVNPAGAATVKALAVVADPLKDSIHVVVNKTRTIYAEVKDVYGNHVDAGTTGSAVTFYVDSAYHGSVSSASGSVVEIGGKKYWAVDYIAPTRSNTDDNVNPSPGYYVVKVKLNATGAFDSLKVIAKSDVPAQVKVRVSADTVMASDSTYQTTPRTYVLIADTAKDQYGNKSVKYNLRYRVIGTGGFAKSVTLPLSDGVKYTLVADTLIETGSGSAAGIVDSLVYISGPRAGKDTIVISYGTTELARILVTVTPTNVRDRVKFEVRRIDAIAGQTVYANIELYDQFGNRINATSSDSANIILQLLRGSGTILNSGKPVAITSDKKLRIGYATNASVADTTAIRALLGISTPDTIWIYSRLPGGLVSYGVTTDTVRAFVGDSVRIRFEARDSAGNRIYTYNARGWRVVVSGDTSAPGFRVNDFYVTGWTAGKASPAYFSRRVDPATLTVFLPDSIFNNGVANLYFRSKKASSGLVLTLVDTAKNVSASSASIKWLPGSVDKYKIIPDSLSYTIVGFPRNIGYKVWPLDAYDNLNTDSVNVVNISTNVGDEVNVGSNPKLVKGLSAFTAQVVRGGALYTTGLVLYASDIRGKVGVSDTIRFNILVKVEQDNAEIPKEFALYQNYPNPFNPATEIKFDIPKESHVKIVIYDITGKEVKTLVDEVVKPGAYRILWDGTDNSGNKVTSGIYFYRMIAGSYVSVKKMVLIK